MSAPPRGKERPFGLVGEWLGGLAVLGSAPARVASAGEDLFELVASQPSVSDGADARVGGGWVGWLGYGLGGRIERLPPSPPAPVPRPADSRAREGSVDLARLIRSDAVFLTSSIRGRHPARLQAGVPRYDPAGMEVPS